MATVKKTTKKKEEAQEAVLVNPEAKTTRGRKKTEVKEPAVKSIKIGQMDIVGQDDTKNIVRVGVDKNYPVLLVGDTGCGKTSIVKNIADEYKAKWVRFNLTGETTVDEFVGKYVLKNEETVWEDGILLS